MNEIYIFFHDMCALFNICNFNVLSTLFIRFWKKFSCRFLIRAFLFLIRYYSRSCVYDIVSANSAHSFKYSIIFSKKKVSLTNKIIKFSYFFSFFKLFFIFYFLFLSRKIISFDTMTFEFVWENFSKNIWKKKWVCYYFESFR